MLLRSWFLPKRIYEKKYGKKMYSEGERIPGAKYYDIDEIQDSLEFNSFGIPHQNPSDPRVFDSHLAILGISESDHVILYDQQGIFAARRVFYTLKHFGFSSVSVLNGGLKVWKELGLPVENGTPSSF